MKQRHCDWCGVFLSKRVHMTCWRVEVHPSAAQVPWTTWNYWARYLCRSCARAATEPHIWQSSTTLRHVAERRIAKRLYERARDGV